MQVFFNYYSLKFNNDECNTELDNRCEETGRVIFQIDESYKESMNAWVAFKKFYLLFRCFIKKNLTEESKKNFKDYNFLYKFLQYDSFNDSKEKTTNIRTKEIMNYFKEFYDPINALKNGFFPDFKLVMEECKNLLDKEDNELLKNLGGHLKDIIENDLKDYEKVFDTFQAWVKSLLSLKIFDLITKNDLEPNKVTSTVKFTNVYITYLDYNYFIEPPLMFGYFLDSYDYVCGLLKKNKKSPINKEAYAIVEDNFELKNVVKAYLQVLLNINTFFKLEHAFYDFLILFNEKSADEKNREKIEKLRKFFLILSYWFNLAGVFHKRSGKINYFVKNFYKASKFLEEKKKTY